MNVSRNNFLNIILFSYNWEIQFSHSFIQQYYLLFYLNQSIYIKNYFKIIYLIFNAKYELFAFYYIFKIIIK